MRASVFATTALCLIMTSAPAMARDHSEADVQAARQMEQELRRQQEQARAAAEQAKADAARRADDQRAAQRRAEQAAQRQADRAAQRQTEIDAQRRSERAAQRQSEIEAQQRADRAAQRQAEQAAQRQAEREAERRSERAAQRQAEIEAQQRAARAAQRQAEIEAQQRAARAAQRQAERETQQRADRAAQRQADRAAQRQAERAAERQAERAAQRAAAAANGAGRGEISRDRVFSGQTRRSSEEFSNGPVGSNSARASDSGLSNFEKALLLGLGAVVVGSVLNNGDEVVSNTGDRVVVRRDGDLRVLKNDDVLLRQDGNDVQTETFSDGSTRTRVQRDDGSQVVTIRGADGTVLRRTRILPDGREYTLFDDTRSFAPVDVARLGRQNTTTVQPELRRDDPFALRRALQGELGNRPSLERSYSLDQVRSLTPVRALAPEVEVNAITFRTGSSAIAPDQARELADLGLAISDIIRSEPDTVILVEGHTDAVGSATYNLALSDRRAETVALALTEYFDVPPENLITQGYGEADLKIPTQFDEPQNRRAVVRNITPLLR